MTTTKVVSKIMEAKSFNEEWMQEVARLEEKIELAAQMYSESTMQCATYDQALEDILREVKNMISQFKMEFKYASVFVIDEGRASAFGARKCNS
jgi:citrate lyase alpha subunit